MNNSASASDSKPEPDDIPTREVNLAEALEMAIGMQRRNELEQAEQIYVTVLENMPGEPNALHFLGVLRYQQGRNKEALHYIASAIEQLPGVAGPWLNLSNVLLESGEFDDAIDALKKVVELDPDSVGAYNNLGVLRMRLGQWEEAEKCFNLAVERNPEGEFSHFNLARLCFKTGRYSESAQHGMRSLRLKQNGGARWLLSLSLFKIGESEQAIANLRAWAEEEPDNAEAAHYLAAATSSKNVGQAPARASDAYVEQVFDRFAVSFDARLEALGYQAPQLVFDCMAGLGEKLPRGGLVLDAGCGTGLCGPLLRPLADRLEGVDLSSAMLARAKTRGQYDELHHAELTEFLQSSADRFDIVASADTLVYFGDLEPLMSALFTALKPGGVFAASVEARLDGGVDHSLELSGRYTHSADYLRKVIEGAGLQVASMQQQVVRREFSEEVQGWIFAAIKPAVA